MVNIKEKMLKDIGYEEERMIKPKEEKAVKTKVSKNNPSVNKNSQLEGY